MISFAEKLIFSIICSLILSIFSTFFTLIIKPQIPLHYSVFLELFLLSVPYFIFFSQTIDFIAGSIGAVFYSLVKSILLFYLAGTPVCLGSILIFVFAFSIISLAIAYQREQSLKEAKLSFLGTAGILFAFIFSFLLLITYYTLFQEFLCIKLPELPPFFRSLIKLLPS